MQISNIQRTKALSPKMGGKKRKRTEALNRTYEGLEVFSTDFGGRKSQTYLEQ